ncbi:hypothetical protein GCM10009122_17590 [Fulvivirga kasyanovii]|uniref:CPXCG motif-containing cysteine-rich protein n=1 Tax=Fulvivirga kasyanovii TaxID=396812 RepID=A0ABW9RQH6_9BACT|nr:CPXCG motif-containing cysteine-rich protein [Fulvivirga kasyanovii]MTI26424.1 CPXCG motif-containing cysteine-rich protein [Fulvivirga kasyanovii]
MLTLEYYFTCPYCGEQISMLLDISVPHQDYIEDCEVCCNPIRIRYDSEGENLTSFIAESIEQ